MIITHTIARPLNAARSIEVGVDTIEAELSKIHGEHIREV